MLSLQLAKKSTPSPFRPFLRPLWPLSIDIFSSLEQDMIHILGEIIASMKLMDQFHHQLIQETTVSKNLPVVASSTTKSIEHKAMTPAISINTILIENKAKTPAISINTKSTENKAETSETSINTKSTENKAETSETSINKKSTENKAETSETSINTKSTENKAETSETSINTNSTENKAETALTIHDIKPVEGGFVVSLEVQDFSPQELTVKLVGKKLLVSGARECKSEDGKGSFSYKCQIFRKEVDLPHDVQAEDLSCTVTDGGQLQIDVCQIPAQERTVPIQHAALHAKTQVSSNHKDSRS